MLLRNALMIAVAAGAVSMAAPAFAQSKSPGDINAGKSNAGAPTYMAPGQRNERTDQGATGNTDSNAGNTGGTTGAGPSDSGSGAGSDGSAGGGGASGTGSGGAGAGAGGGAGQ